jgi:uncharacterized repeat protein (TIGR02543 family)
MVISMNVYLYIESGVVLSVNGNGRHVNNGGTVIFVGNGIISYSGHSNWENKPGSVVIGEGRNLHGNPDILTGAKFIDREEYYLVTLNANGGFINVTQSRVTVAVLKSPDTSLSSVVSSATTLNRNGYTFDDWYTTSAAGTVWNFATIVNDDMEIFAQWISCEYNITYIMPMLDGTNPDSNPEKYSTSFSDVPIANAFDPRAKFQGWYVEYCVNGTQSLVAQLNFNILAGTYGDIELAAIFDSNPVSYGITYELDGGINALSNRNSYTATNEFFPIKIY